MEKQPCKNIVKLLCVGCKHLVRIHWVNLEGASGDLN